jgi:HEAT repeat protein
MGERGVHAISQLLSLCDDPSPDVRRFLAITLGKLKSRTDNVLRVLRELNDDPDASVRVGACYALAFLGEDAVAHVRRLLPLMSHEESSVRFLTAWALGEVGTHDKENAVYCLVKALTIEDHEGNRELMSQSLKRVRKS